MSIGPSGPLSSPAAVLLVILLVGLSLFRWYRTSYSFTLYIAVACLAYLAALAGFWPAELRAAWEIVLCLLYFAMAGELAYRALRAFPGAVSTARHLAVIIIALAALSMAIGLPSGHPGATEFEAIQTRLVNGAIWLFDAIAVVVLWYRLPMPRLHKAILLGLVAYLNVTLLLALASTTFGWSQSVAALDGLAYVATLSFWVQAVWKRKESLIAPERTGGATEDGFRPVR